MASDGAALSYSVASVVENVLLQQQGIRRHLDLDCRRAEEAALRRNEAAGWLRDMVGVVAARDLPREPSEEEFRLGLRSGIILCNALNKVQPGAVPKVVEGPSDSSLIQDGAALSVYQYFENARNFLVAIQEMGIPTFEASDLEQGGNIARVVNCVMALKSFDEWKQAGGTGVWKFGGNIKPASSVKSIVRKNFNPFMNSLSRNSLMNDKPPSPSTSGLNSTKVPDSLSMLVRKILLDKKPEEVPALVESLLNKLVEEFENRMVNQLEQTKSNTKEVAPCPDNNVVMKPASSDKKNEEKNMKSSITEGANITKSKISYEESKAFLLKQQMLFDEQQRDIDEIKSTLYTTKSGMQFMQMKFDEEFNNLGYHIRGLSSAASAYHRVLEENRKLYNQVQDLKGSIRVYCRVRPFLPGQISDTTTVENIEEGTITISTPSKYGKGNKSFIFNKVFGPFSSQEEVFADTQPLIRSVLDGYNVCIFAYGQTGSGKTYTMTGPRQLTEESHGVNYRALNDLFIMVEQRKDTFRYDISVQMIEIYNEQVRDLLVSDGTNKRLEIRNSSQSGLNVPGASLVPVSSTPDVLDLMNIGQRNRAVGATAMNDRSSRSHSCLTVHVQGRDLTSGAILRGCMHLVDLAGSERVDKSEATGDRLKEAQHINRSLSALGDVISALSQRNTHVPYRNSKLTQLLQDSLGGQAKTLMFVHISPEPSAVGETISTLKFAERVATVELGAAQVNKDGADVKELKEQIASLKAALAMKEEQPICNRFATDLPQNSTAPINSERRRRKATDLPSFSSIPINFDALSGQDSIRQPMGDVGNIEISCASLPMQKKQNIDIDEQSGLSPPWPPIACQNYREDDKGVGNGDWVDKVMVNNKQGDAWEPENDNLTDVFYSKYLNGSKVTTTEINSDASTSDSSEHDLPYQLNHTKLNGSSTGAKKSASRSVKAMNSRNLSSVQGPSPSRKALNGGGLPLPRSARVQLPDSKRKHTTTNRK